MDAHANRPIESYRDFWPYYLQEHAKPETRAIHYVGTILSSACVFAAFVTGNLWAILYLTYPTPERRTWRRRTGHV